MQQFQFVIKNPQGLHARPAGLLVKEIGKFQSAVTISKDGKAVDGRKIFSLMGLAAKQNDTLVIEAEGSDEAATIAFLKQYMEQNF